MQTIWRKVGQSIQIGDSITVTVDLIRRGRVRIVVKTPQGTKILWLNEGEEFNALGEKPLTRSEPSA